MLKNFLLLVFTSLAMLTYGQKSTLLQNINYRAKELKHSLNKVGDSLILQSERTIYSVEIFNQHYEKLVQVGSNEVKIPLHGTPLGRLVVQAKMIDKRILITLQRHDTIKAKPIEVKPIEIAKARPKAIDLPIVKSLQNIRLVTLDVLPEFSEQLNLDIITVTIPKPEIKLTLVNEQEPIIEKEEIEIIDSVVLNEGNTNLQPKPKTSLSGMLNWKAKKPNTSEKVFWIAHIVNSGTTSRKSMKLVSQSEIDRIIAKHKIESKTNQGKLNKLTVWEVYDTVKFMQKQAENPDYINSAVSNLFDVSPYYSSAK
ncbi:hypothetical protein [Winogradskyella sp. MIT101101]|uniref:hypothetical protein n=1 Tax=Winogradskyella sp. MIT101101 TaxID=3098297 RepID=UPI00399AE55F